MKEAFEWVYDWIDHGRSPSWRRWVGWALLLASLGLVYAPLALAAAGVYLIWVDREERDSDDPSDP